MTGTVVIRCLGMAGFSVLNGADAPKGQYLKSYDPEAHDGQGFAEWTDDPSQAKKFISALDAHALWTTIPKSRPTRPDGRPNRPLTAFSIAVEEL